MKEKVAKYFTTSNGIFSAFFLITALGCLITPTIHSNDSTAILLFALFSFVCNPVIILFDIIAAIIGEDRIRRWNIIFFIADVLLEIAFYYLIVLSVG